eukprot:CAMPEP_0194214874 /NCGR_PEP_ID=MMETSP0156-20130528/16271_1 /TAXON_ID=33649 /ORGANISM="Thalassionema nitzschioides, Strain L26-B" /LENGTH=363 /DNA_ID=CAMNT_0038943229 /DNA_START=142 /DNA_END=1233 /DNA_ORIENTATION=-
MSVCVLLAVPLMQSKNGIQRFMISDDVEERLELTHREVDELCINNTCSSSNGFIEPYSGCVIADVVYAGSFDCHERYGSKVPYVHSFWQISQGAVLYVGFDAMPSFEVFMLPSLKVDIILITGSLRFGPHYVQHAEAAQRILAHPRIKLWMTQNPFATHPKMHGFPYGLRLTPDGAETDYKNVYDSLPQRTNESRELLFHSYFSVQNNRGARGNIPNGKRLSYHEYLEQMSRHQYVLSPNGDRADCFRNYEAIGLGTIPIVQTSEERYGWMQDAVFGIPTELWNDTEALAERYLPHTNSTGAHREFVLLDYWRLRVKALKRKAFNTPADADNASGTRVRNHSGTEAQPTAANKGKMNVILKSG